MHVSGHGGSRGKFAQHNDSTRGFVLVQDHQLDSGIWARLPLFISGKCDVLEHRSIKDSRSEIASHPRINIFTLARSHSTDKTARVLLFREKIPPDWLPKVINQLPAVLVDHAHLERKAATTALNLEKYRDLYSKVGELNSIAIEELQHFQLVLNRLNERGIPFSQAQPSPWISGLMRSVRNGQRHQVIDHLICCALIEGRSCEKFQILSRELTAIDAPLAEFYGSLVESEGNHYATYILMAREIDDAETDHRLDFYLNLDADLMRKPNLLPILH
jgi:tRNA 2-(methylsulfanyl)-N6-isopentenyladenosine37 hydroxylase